MHGISSAAFDTADLPVQSRWKDEIYFSYFFSYYLCPIEDKK